MRCSKVSAVLLALGMFACSSNDASQSASGAERARDAGNATSEEADTGLPDFGDDPTSPNGPTDAAGGGDADGEAMADAGADTGSGTQGRSAGCTGGNALPEGEIKFTFNGAQRRYILRKPKMGLADKAWPLVLTLHGNGGNAEQFDRQAGPGAVRPTFANQAILVIAEAKSGDWRENKEEDFQYLGEVIKNVEDAMCVDTKRIFSMGSSGGGSFSGYLACYRKDIRAFVSASGVTYYDPAKCTGKAAAWFAVGGDEASSARMEYRDDWRTRNACTAATTPTEPSPCVAYACPDDGYPVHYCEHSEGHGWTSFSSGAALAFFSRF